MRKKEIKVLAVFFIAIILLMLCLFEIFFSWPFNEPDKRIEGKVTFAKEATASLYVDFGVAEAEVYSGGGVVGSSGGTWNSVSKQGSNDFTISGLKFSDGQTSAVSIRVINLDGAQAISNELQNANLKGKINKMYDTFLYSKSNQGANSYIYFSNIPKGYYDFYVYGHGGANAQNGDYTLFAGSENSGYGTGYGAGYSSKNYGRKLTSTSSGAVSSETWKEGLQYVKYSNVFVSGIASILVQPGEKAFQAYGYYVSNSLINGMQIVPTGTKANDFDKPIDSSADIPENQVSQDSEAEQVSENVTKKNNSKVENVSLSPVLPAGELTAGEPGISHPPALKKNDLKKADDSADAEEGNEKEITCETGCLLDKACYDLGYHRFDRYCSEDGTFKKLTEKYSACNKSFECASDICKDGRCTEIGDIVKKSKGVGVFINKGWCRLKNLFSPSDYERCVTGYIVSKELS
jgi:hypothetical protein